MQHTFLKFNDYKSIIDIMDSIKYWYCIGVIIRITSNNFSFFVYNWKWALENLLFVWPNDTTIHSTKFMKWRVLYATSQDDGVSSAMEAWAQNIP